MSSPLVQATIQACVLTAVSNVIAQCITIYRAESLYTIDWTPVLRFIIYAALSQPPNFLWQQFLEARFPAKTPRPPSATPAAAAATEKHPERERLASGPAAPRFNTSNALLKFAIDQTLGSAVNTVLFSLVMAGLKGASWGEAVQVARQDFWGLVMAGWKLWPFVSAINYTFVKTVGTRTLVGNLAGVGWSIYLSLVTR